MNHDRAYVTFLAGDGDYVKGVVGLAKGLRKVNAAYPLVVAALSDMPEEHRRMLAEQGCAIREIEAVQQPDNGTKFAWDYYAINYSKLRIWETCLLHVCPEFVEYRKVIYLDGDTQVYDNIDNLFHLPDGYLYAAVDCLCEAWDQRCPEKVPWPPGLGPEPLLYFNAGVLVFEPSLSTYHDLLTTLQLTPPTSFAEQDFLNMLFKDIYKPISPIYNLALATLWRHPANIELDQVKVVHYCVKGSKPWRYTGEEENMDREDVRMLVNRWWEIYNDGFLDSSSAADGRPDEFTGVHHLVTSAV